MKALVVAVLAALLAAGEAAAHVDVRPGLLESGTEVELLVELPELRPGEPPTALSVGGDDVRQLSSRPAGRAGQKTQWSVRIAIDAPPGPAELLLTASFADGEVVEVRRAVTIVPATADDATPFAAFAAAAVALAALVGAAIVLRRRPRSA